MLKVMGPTIYIYFNLEVGEDHSHTACLVENSYTRNGTVSSHSVRVSTVGGSYRRA